MQRLLEAHTWYDLALLEGLHEAVHLLLCQEQVHIVLRGGEKKIQCKYRLYSNTPEAEEKIHQ